MSILKVARMGHPVLRARARTVDKAELKNPVFQHFVDSMIDTMYEYSGVGLAAPQVHESVRLFVAMLGLAAANRFALTSGLGRVLADPTGRQAAVTALRRSLIMETGVGVAVLALVAWFGTLAPPASL